MQATVISSIAVGSQTNTCTKHAESWGFPSQPNVLDRADDRSESTWEGER